MEQLPIAAAGPEITWSIMKAIAVLGFLCLAAFILLRYVAPRMGFRKAGKGGSIELLERYILGPRRVLYIIRAGTRRLLVGGGEGGLRLLADLTDDQKDS